MTINWRTEIFQWLILAGMVIVAAVLWPLAPESFPVHWNIRGEVDRFGGKFEGLMVVPLMAVLLYGLMVVLPRFDPGRANYQSFRNAYFAIRLGLLVFLAVIQATMLFAAFGFRVNVNLIIAPAVGVLLIVMGNFMGKIRPNWFVGIRTPWTLSSRRSWNQTHRLGGWIFIAMGIAIAMCGILQTLWMLVLTISFSFIAMVWLVAYSYLVWRQDPEKLSVGSIVPAPEANEP